MSEFNLGDKVRAKHDIENMIGSVKKGSIGTTVLSDPRHKEWAKIFFGKELYTFDFDGITVHTDSDDVEKIESEETYVERQAKCGLKKGDKVRVLRTAEYGEGGWVHPHSYLIKDYVGAVGEIRDFKEKGVKVWFEELNSRFWPPYFVLEKVESEETETPKPENLRNYRIELKGKPPLIFVGTFDNADNESRYFSTPEGVEYEVKEELITLVISEKA